MTTLQSYQNEKRETVNIWFEYINGGFDFWVQTDSISISITERQYLNRIEKYNLYNHLQESN